MSSRTFAGTRWASIALLPVLLSMLLLAACDEKSSEPVLTPVDRIEVTANQISIREDATTQVSARVLASLGDELQREVVWNSSDQEIATVDANGVVTGKRGGVVRIVATVGDRTGSVGITVEEYVRSIELTAIPELGVAAMVQLEATLRCANGHVMTRPIRWTSSDPAIFAVSNDGTITALSPGVAKVVVSSGETTVETQVSVGAPVAAIELTASLDTLDVGQMMDVAVTLRDRDGRLLNRAVTWSTDGPAADVDATGRVVAREEGTVSVMARSEGVVGMAVVAVRDRVTRIEMERAAITLRPGEVVQATARAYGANGLQPDRTIAWLSADPSVATAGDGMIEARSPGQTVVTASAMGMSATMGVRVEKPIARLALRWPAVDVRLGGHAQLMIDAWDEDGSTIHPRFTWASSDPNTVGVNEVGDVVGYGLGTATVTATAEGYTLTSLVRVFEPLEPYTVVIVPQRLEVMVGDTGSLTAIVRDVQGRVLDVDVNWMILDPGIVSIYGEGTVTGLAAGVAEIVAEYKGYVSKKAEVIVRTVPPEVHSVTLTPGRHEMGLNQWVAMSAVVRDGEGGILNLPVTWGLSKTGVVVVNKHGVVESIGEGVVEVWAECHGIRARAEIIVRREQVGW